MDGLENTFQVRDANIRPGGSPTDALLTVKDVSLVIGDNEIQTIYKEGSEVGYIAFKKAIVDSDGKITLTETATSDALIMILGRDMNQTVGGKAF